MTDKASHYVMQSSGRGNSISVIQKSRIEEAVLTAIANGTYYDGLEEKACKAVSYINQFSDAEAISELIDTESCKKYQHRHT